MKLNYLFLTIFAVAVFTSCNQYEKFPEFITAKVLEENVRIMTSLSEQTKKQSITLPAGNMEVPGSLLLYQQQYMQRNEEFDLKSFQNKWYKIKEEINIRDLDEENLKRWFDVTGFLFQLTGDEAVAGELERIVWSGFSGLTAEIPDSVFSPYIFTKNVDHIHVNFFLPAEISYKHSLGGKVNIVQETGFPESGSIRLLFNMETKRYIELNVRIPSWAENASVTVKKVKYFAEPGSYCIVAKKWKQDDLVEIEFPVDNLSEYLKN